MAWSRLILRPLLAFLACFGVATAGAAQPESAAIDWQGDLAFLAEMLPRVHDNAFHTVSRRHFEGAVEDLRRRLPALSDAEARVEFAALVAMIGDGHTRVNLLVPNSPGVPAEVEAGFVPVPVNLYWYDEGIAVQSADASQADLAGSRLVEIAGMPIEEAAARLQRFVHHDNAMTVRLILPFLMTRPAFLKGAGVIDDMTAVPMLFETAGGERIARRLAPLADADRTAVNAYAEPDSAARPLWLRDNDRPYWMEVLDQPGDPATLYIQFNVVRDRGEESLAAFAERAERTIADAHIERVIVDLRHNDGGNFVVALPLLDVLGRFDDAHGAGSLFVAIGRATFSAAGMFAALVEARTDAVFVGEPTGARPNTYGDMDSFALPASGLVVSYSERYFQPSSPYDERPWLDPDVSATLGLADYRSGRDPVWAAIARYVPQPPLLPRLLEAATAGSVEDAMAIYRTHRARPENAYYWAADDLVELGYHYWRTDALADALTVWRRLAQDYPESPEGTENIVETYQAMDDAVAAREALFEALGAHPDNRDSVELVAEICGAEAVRAMLAADVSRDEGRAAVRARCTVPAGPAQ